MGVVVAAWHIELDQRVAVKFLLTELATRGDSAERFRREARAAVKIKSEHVARVLDVDTTSDGVPYMVMEYLEGQDLSRELRARGALEVGEAVDVVVQCCEAIAEAHAAGIVHRDLKPANLFLAERSDGTRIVKVLDFGISKSLAPDGADLSLTKTSALIGSPLYMSPEQMENARDVDGRTDIWSLGAILYECLSGKPPFAATSFPQVCAMVLNDTPASLRATRADVPAALEDALFRCLEKKRDARWSSVAELAGALSGFASARGRISAERAARLLSGSAPGLRSSPRISIDVGASGMDDSPTVNANGSLAAPVPGSESAPPGARTIDSWGRTGGGSIAPRRRKTLLVSLGAGLAVAATGIWWAMTSDPGTAASAATPGSAALAAPPEAPARAPSSAALAPSERATPPEPPSASASAAPAASATGDPQGPRHPAGPATRGRGAAKPASAPPRASPALSDFGGRE